MTTHHLPDELLEEYSRGQLSGGWSLGVASHLALCPCCRQRSGALDALGGALLEDIEPAALNPDALTSVMERVSKGSEGGAAAPRTPVPEPVPAPVLPEPLRSCVGGDVENLKWRRLSGDVSQVVIDTGDASTMCRLLRVKAGRPVAEHSHGGGELTLVLSGSFSDALGTFGRGDVEFTDETVEHQPVAGPDEDCICFAVTDAPLRFRNPIVRLLQPLFKI